MTDHQSVLKWLIFLLQFNITAHILCISNCGPQQEGSVVRCLNVFTLIFNLIPSLCITLARPKKSLSQLLISFPHLLSSLPPPLHLPSSTLHPFSLSFSPSSPNSFLHSPPFSVPLPPQFSSLSSFHLPSLQVFLHPCPPLNSARSLRRAVSSPNRVWGRAPAEI